MPNFKAPSGELHFLEDANFAYLLPEGCIEITEADAMATLNPPKPIGELKGQLYGLVSYLHAGFIERKTGSPSTQEVASWKAKRDLAIKLEGGIEPEADELAFLVAAGATDDAGRKAIAAQIKRKAIAYGEILGGAETRRNACHADIAALSDVAQEPDIRAAIYARWEDL